MLLKDIVIVIYLLICICLSVYGLHHYFLLFNFFTKQKKHRDSINAEIKDYYSGKNNKKLPFVTIQLPVYNEINVVDRLITNAAGIDYPKDLFEIQILDDSTDNTTNRIKSVIKSLKKEGIQISLIRRNDRTEYKAGALQNGLKVAKGQYLAIFDSDFIIPANFLKRTVPLIDQDDNVACVQTRWGHINRNENIFTKGISMGIDGHFLIEQGARNYNGLFMNFNGTGGIWRKEAIIKAGGWSGETLTEDLDLSYRTQIAGYKIKYDYDTECKAEVPFDIAAFKIQQSRWAKGATETAKKLMPEIIRSKKISFLQKLEAFFHLKQYFISFFMLLHCIFTPIFFSLVQTPKINEMFFPVWIFITVSSFAPFLLYISCGILQKKTLHFILYFPVLMLIGYGICVSNTIAILEAYLGIKSSFVRTPKKGSTDKSKGFSIYKVNLSFLVIAFEIFFGVYSILTMFLFINKSLNISVLFILFYALGLLTFGFYTIYRNLNLNTIVKKKAMDTTTI